MALKLFPIPFPIFSPPSPPIRPLFPVPNLNPNPSPTEVQFSRWNNANAEKFNERRRAQQQIEDEHRRRRRFNSIDNIASVDYSATEANAKAETTFRSVGTPSSPSAPSIPGRKSKYSKPESGTESHPAFCRNIRIRKTPQQGGREQRPAAAFSDRKADLRIGEDGVSYVIDGAPFEFKYSYTETPKKKPVKLREAPYSPFGPTTMGRPWTGRAPLPPSKKKLKEFDSFVLPPPGKKGVKPVQAPGPFRPGSGPRYVKTREEILGEPLTKEEIRELVDGCLKSKRQLNMGRDGLTHNMLDNIHAHWKRRRVCRIKCKGVCTVDMDNVCQQLEERTGGKIIDRKGGVLYLFRGRNYNHRTRPRFPLMLWKPAAPVYPRLVQRVPEGLTLEEATEMRKKGRSLIPICKLGKNGTYSNLVRHVREAFGECELVRINCQGLNPSDYRKIGAKLRDLVPCVLISFEHEHILMWRGKDWKPFTKPVNDCEEGRESNIDGLKSVEPPTKDQESQTVSGDYVNTSELEMQASVTGSDGEVQDPSALEIDELYTAPEFSPTTEDIYETETTSETSAGESECTSNIAASEVIFKIPGCSDGMSTAASTGAGTLQQSVESVERLNDASEGSLESEPAKLSVPYVDIVLQLWKQAVESGTAAVLVDAHLDADAIFQKSVALAKSAPPGPVFRRRPKEVSVEECEKQETANLEAVEVAEVVTVPKKDRRDSKSSKLQKRTEFSEQFVVSVPKGSLGVDELAKLLT